MKIERSVALVTGANRGLGKSLVASLARAGASRIYAAARRLEALEPVVAIDPQRIVALKLDVTNERDVEAAARRAPDVSLLVNNAGALSSFNVLSSESQQLHQDFAVNFFGVLGLVKAFLPALERAQGAAIANVLTVVSLASRPVIGGYAASKAAAFSLTQSLRPELKAKKIDVHSVIPGAVDTDMIRAFPIAKTSPDVVADAIVAGIGRGEEDILTDPMAKEAYQAFLQNPKDFERHFGSL